jgi:hypothetical protein
MHGRTVILRLHEGRLWFNATYSIEIKKSNLPVSQINFGKVKDVFWLVEQLSFDHDSQTLHVNVKDYFLRDYEDFSNQHPKATIDFVHFENLSDAASMKLALRYYTTEMGMLDRAMEEGYEELAGSSDSSPEKISKKNPLFRSYPDQEKLELKFEVWFKDAEFKLGYIAFDKNIPKLKQMLRFQVSNDFLLPEFEFIKGYFIKALGTRKFEVDAVVFLEQGKVTGTGATSPIIMRINESLIDSIKTIRTFGITRSPMKVNIDKSLFTSEDIFGEFDDIPNGNVFSQSEQEILRQILEKYNVRNRKQLEYLSGVKQAPGTRLKFTLHPYFGFLFAVEGERMMHFIWELLNTHATYIWSLDKGEGSLERQSRRVEDAINQVRSSGRELYKQSWHASHIDQDLVFNVIQHQDANSPFVDGFVLWRHRLGELLV